MKRIDGSIVVHAPRGQEVERGERAQGFRGRTQEWDEGDRERSRGRVESEREHREALFRGEEANLRSRVVSPLKGEEQEDQGQEEQEQEDAEQEQEQEEEQEESEAAKDAMSEDIGQRFERQRDSCCKHSAPC
jgi:hypothetical protein